jgi:signal transduction histidine kinase/CheY-like chemotaxis protein
MKTNTNIFKKITNLGVVDGLKIEEIKRIKLTNILGSFPLVIYIYFIYFGLTEQYYFPVVTCSTLSIIVVIGLYLNHKRKYGLAKLILFSANSLFTFATYNCLNIDYSIVSYFFPLLIAYEIVFDAKKEFMTFLPSILFTIICIVACFVLPKYLLYSYEMSAELLKTSNILNYIFPLLISVTFIFTIINIHAKAQDKLLAAIEESEKANKAKSDFLSNMSHELRTPLNGIIGTTNLLIHEHGTNSQKKYHEVLQHTSDHMLHLINHILDFSKINEGKINLDRNTFNIKHVIAKLCRVYQAQNTQENVQFTYEIDEALDRSVIGDDLRLKQILFNLLSNSFKFTKRGSIILKAALLKSDANKMSVRFSILDTGIGIKQEQLQKIFESFEQADSSTTRNYGGTGLGLSISKELVRLFGSSLKVESEYKKGSTFSFEIDVEISQVVVDKNVNKLQADKKIRGLNVLVAEDNKVNMMVLLTFLKRWDVTYTEVSNGSLALAKFKQNDYNLILMDLEMPEMDGYTAIKEIRKQDTNIPVIAFTAALYDNMVLDLKSKGFDDYLHKPFNPIDLHTKISKYSLYN